MIVGIVYTVTKASDNREFIVGDCFWLLPRGDIINLQANRMMKAENVAKAIKSMEYANVETLCE